MAIANDAVRIRCEITAALRQRLRESPTPRAFANLAADLAALLPFLPLDFLMCLSNFAPHLPQ